MNIATRKMSVAWYKQKLGCTGLRTEGTRIRLPILRGQVEKYIITKWEDAHTDGFVAGRRTPSRSQEQALV